MTPRDLTIGIVAGAVASVAAPQELGDTAEMRITWSATTTTVEGDPIDSSDLLYRIYTEAGVKLCETTGLSCVIELPWDTCIMVYGTAEQLSTGMESGPSNKVQGCTPEKPTPEEYAPLPPVMLNPTIIGIDP